MPVALIALGGNISPERGDIKDTLEAALTQVRDLRCVTCVTRSRWFRTPAFPPGSGPDFVNGAARVETTLGPQDLLEALHAIEADLGRRRKTRWAPRVCDIDLVAHDGAILPDEVEARRWMVLDLGEAQTLVPPRLILPHPRMHERAFVLVPLADVAPGWRHPLSGRSVAEMLDALSEAERASVVPLDAAGSSPGGA